MSRFIIGWPTALALAFFVVPVLAASPTETHQGTVVKVTGNKLTMSDRNGHEMTHTMADNAKITCDGKPCPLSDLKPGMHIWVTTPANNITTATMVRAETRPPEASGRAFLGIQGETALQPEGVVIRNVEPNGPAARAGLRDGDIIRGIDNQPVRDFRQLVHALAQDRPNKKVTIHIRRAGKEEEKEVTLGQLPSALSGETGAAPAVRPTAFLGVETRPLTQEEKNRLAVLVKQGAVVTEVVPNTPAQQAGIQRGDVITEFNNQPVHNPEQLWQAVQQAGANKEVTIKAARGEKTREFKAHLEPAPADLFTPPARR